MVSLAMSISLKIGFVGESISIRFRKLPAAVCLTQRSYVTCNFYGKIITLTEIRMGFPKKSKYKDGLHIVKFIADCTPDAGLR